MVPIHDYLGIDSSPVYPTFQTITGVQQPLNQDSSGLLASLGGLASLLGPAGTAVGVVANLIPGLDGFLQNGFDFSCLGGQAFDKAKLDQYLLENKKQYDDMLAGTLSKTAFLDRIFDWREDSKIEISRYDSGCSKLLRQKLLDYQNKMYEDFDKSNITYTETTRVDWKGATLPARKHVLKTAEISAMPAVTPQQFETELKPQIQAYALQNGLNVDDAVNTAYQNLFPGSGGYGSGGVVVNEDGSIDWNVSAGNNKPNYTGFLLIGGLAFLAYKVLKK